MTIPSNHVHGSPRLAATSASYRVRAVGLLVSLFAFVALYCALFLASGALLFTSCARVVNPPAPASSISYPTGERQGPAPAVWALVSVVSGILFLFFAKGLLYPRRLDRRHMVEVTAAEQPRFFAFLQELASEARADLPGRVYVTTDVNAAVAYPRSLLALVWPVRKDLIVGAGLLTGVDVAELRAVLAHELGHFSQVGVRLGQYVYVSANVITDLVFQRDRWDIALRKWGRANSFLSVPAWIVTGLVFVVRAVLVRLFRALTRAWLSLSREMEFAADAVAVRLAGSDAVVAGLWKSQRAGLALRLVLAELEFAAEQGMFSKDLYVHQASALAKLEQLAAGRMDPRGEIEPLLRNYQPGKHLHFPPRSEPCSEPGLPHPSDHEREVAAKARYVPSPPDTRGAWALFDAPERIRNALTTLAYGTRSSRGTSPVDPAEVELLLEEERGERRHAAKFHGLYDRRFINSGNLDELEAQLDGLLASGNLDIPTLRARAQGYVGDDLGRKMDRLRGLTEQACLISRLAAMKEPESKPVTRAFRGQERSRQAILALQPEVAREMRQATAQLESVDHSLFFLYYAIASKDAALKDELLLRYRFVVAVQDMLAELRPFEGPLEEVLFRLRPGTELQHAEVEAMRSLTTLARDSLRGVLVRARSTKLPPLAPLGEKLRLDDFLLPQPLVPDLFSLKNAWILELTQQHRVVVRRLSRIGFKNLGKLLRLCEDLDPTIFPGDP